MRSIKYKQSHENLIMFIKLHSRKTPQTDEFNREVKKKITKDGNKIIIFDTSVDTFIVQDILLISSKEYRFTSLPFVHSNAVWVGVSFT